MTFPQNLPKLVPEQVRFHGDGCNTYKVHLCVLFSVEKRVFVVLLLFVLTVFSILLCGLTTSSRFLPPLVFLASFSSAFLSFIGVFHPEFLLFFPVEAPQE